MPEVWQQLVSEYPALQLIWDALAIIFPLSALLAYSGLFFISSVSKIIGIAKKRSAFEKCSVQLGFIGLVLGWVLLASARVWLYLTQAEREPGSLENFMAEMGWMLLSMGVLLSTIYYFLRRVLKNMPVLHVTIGMIAAVQNCIGLAAILFTVHLLAVEPRAPLVSAPLELFPAAWEAPVWELALLTVPLIFAMAGAVGACWLAARRNRDNFGRDYYNAMVPWCAAWARNAWSFLFIFVAGCAAWALWQSREQAAFITQDAIYESCALLFWAIPLLLWAIVKKNRLPMRHAWLLFLALALAMCFMLQYFLQLVAPLPWEIATLPQQ